MIEFDDVYRAIYNLPFMQRMSLRDPSLSYPLVREVDDVMYVVFMGYSYGDTYPDLIFTYNTESGIARHFELQEGLEFLGIKEFPVKNRWDVEPAEPYFLEDLFWKTVITGYIDKDAYEQYISTIVAQLTYGEGPYYWAFAE